MKTKSQKARQKKWLTKKHPEYVLERLEKWFQKETDIRKRKEAWRHIKRFREKIKKFKEKK